MVKGNADPKVVKRLSEKLSIDTVLAKLLYLRGIVNFDDAKNFFRPNLNTLHDPFLLKNMDKAVNRILSAIKNNEKILIYGDYDVDGTTAVALLYSFIKKTYPNVDFYIPDRYSEGYGISQKSIDFAHENNFSVIISLDCGIKAVKQVGYARQKGIDFIVCDHHRPGEVLPPAYAVVDPKQVDCPYPYKELSGCGLSFKIVQAICKKTKMPFSSLKEYLDLVVVSIAADIVPITGENRTLAYYGLEQINCCPRPGLESILFYSNVIRKNKPDEKTIFTREITISDLVFLVGPRINAAGRIETGNSAVKLLICDNMKDTHDLSLNIDNQNTERRNLDVEITKQALQMIESDHKLKTSKATVIYSPDWHKGVIGIVASRLTESYYRPTIVFTHSNGMITGSARSVKDFDIYDAINACSDYLEHFGGHKYAAGLSLKPDQLPHFSNAFEKFVNENITDEMLVPEIEIETAIKLYDITSKFFRILKQFAPFGPGNSNPVFMTQNLTDRGSARIVGNNHLKIKVSHPDYPRKEFNAIAFQQGDFLPGIQQGKPIDIAYQVEENTWNETTSIQLNISNIRFSDNS